MLSTHAIENLLKYPQQYVRRPESQGEEAPVELTVTAEEEGGHNVPDATTATRTDTPSRDIPASIQVIPQKVFEDQQVIRLEEALRNVSGVRSDNFAHLPFRTYPKLRKLLSKGLLSRDKLRAKEISESILV